MLGKNSKRGFGSVNKTVCILANSKQADLIGSKVMRSLKQVSGLDDIKFFGYGGYPNKQLSRDWMKQEGMAGGVNVDIEKFSDKEFYTFRKTKNFKEAMYYRWYFFNLVTKHYTRTANQMLDALNAHDLHERIHKAKPSVVLSIDNEYMTMQINQQLAEMYKYSPNDMPRRHYYNRFCKDFKQWALPYFDFVHFTVPLTVGTGEGFVFPGEYCGQYGVYEATRHIYSQSKELKELMKDNSILVNREFFGADMEKAIDGVRRDFRARHNIAENATVIFVAPGNEVNEAEFGMENVRKGVKEFLLKYSAPTSLSPKAPPLENYVTVISVQKGSRGEEFVKHYLQDEEWYGRLILVNDEKNEHINAMAGSDMGIVYDGQMVSAAAACHLPTMIMIDMRLHHQWLHDLFNRYWNDMNIIADCNIYPELIGGEAWYGKICDTLAEWYVKPEVRYDMVRRWEYFLKDAMSFQGVDRTKVKGRDLILADGQAYDEYKDPMVQVASHLWNDVQNYNLRSGSPTLGWSN